MRTVILHHHLFKNAGTSVDQVLQHNFPTGWATAEFPGQGGTNTALVREWIMDTPDVTAFSSHTMLGPLPAARGLRVIPLVLLRDPMARIISAYQFERQQQADTKGAHLAKKHDLEGYVRARLAMPGDRQCRSFQTGRLASMMPGPGSEITRALKAAGLIRNEGVLGFVADFDQAMKDLAVRLHSDFPDFRVKKARVNSTAKAKPLPAALRQLIKAHNGDDFALLNATMGGAAAA